MSVEEQFDSITPPASPLIQKDVTLNDSISMFSTASDDDHPQLLEEGNQDERISLQRGIGLTESTSNVSLTSAQGFLCENTASPYLTRLQDITRIVTDISSKNESVSTDACTTMDNGNLRPLFGFMLRLIPASVEGEECAGLAQVMSEKVCTAFYSTNISEIIAIRRQFQEYFNVLSEQLCCNGKVVALLETQLVNDIRDLYEHVRPCEDMLAMGISYGYYHLYLDITWSCVEFWHIIVQLARHSTNKDQELLHSQSKFISRVMYDLYRVCIAKYNKGSAKVIDCNCSCHIWTLLLSLSQDYNSCWQSPFAVLEELFLRKLDAVQLDLAGDHLSKLDTNFYWRFITVLLHALSVCPSGKLSTEDRGRADSIIHSLLQDTLKREGPVMVNNVFDTVIKLCTKYQAYYSLSNKCLSLLIDCLALEINERSQEQLTVSVPSDINTWYNMVTEPPHGTILQKYVHILCKQLVEAIKLGEERICKLIKGRIFFKFYKKTVRQLSMQGLFNCLTLILSLSSLHYVREYSIPLYDILYEVVRNDIKYDSHKQEVIMRSMFVFVLIYQKNNESVDALAKHIINFITLHYDRCKGSKSQQAEMKATSYSIFMIYLDGLREIISHARNEFIHHEHSLVFSKISDMVAQFNDTHQHRMLSVLKRILKLLTFDIARDTAGCLEIQGRSEIIKTLLLAIYPCLKELSLSTERGVLIFSKELGELAVSVTKLVRLVNIRGFDTSDQVIEYFAISDSTACEVSSRYIMEILPILDSDERNMYGEQFIHTYVRCAMQNSEQHMQQFADVMRRCNKKYAAIMQSTNSSMETEEHDQGTADAHLYRFISALSQQYMLAQDFLAKDALRKSIGLYFKNIHKWLKSAIEQCSSVHQMTRMYNLLGHIVQECAGILYSKTSATCVLRVIVEELLLDYHNPGRLQAQVEAAIGQNLQYFLIGLSSLPHVNSEPYIQRVLKRLTIWYLPIVGNKQSCNPLILAIMADTSNQLIPVLFGTIREHFLSKATVTISSAPVTDAQCALNFISLALEQSSEEKRRDLVRLECKSLLSMLVHIMAVTHNRRVRLDACNIITTLCRIVYDCKDIIPVDGTINSMLSTFICSNLTQCGKLFVALKDISERSDYNSTWVEQYILPDVRIIMHRWNRQRGVTSDGALENLYQRYFLE